MHQTTVPCRGLVAWHQLRPHVVCSPAAATMVQPARWSLSGAAGSDKAIQVPDEKQAAVAAEQVVERQQQAAELPAPTSKSSSKGFGGKTTAKATAKAPAGNGKAKVKGQGKQGGRLDMVEVFDWGSGQQEQWGELKVKRVDTLYGRSPQQPPLSQAQDAQQDEPAAGSDTQGSAMAADTLSSTGLTSTATTSFYEQLCHEMAMAQRRGALEVAGPAPPPFTSWSFTPARYMQYLADALAVHEALEAALPTSSTIRSQHPHALLRLLGAMHDCGLGRSKAIQHDLAVLAAHHKAQVPAGPEQTASSHAKQLQRWGRDVQQWLQWQQEHESLPGISGHLQGTLATSAPQGQPPAATPGHLQGKILTPTEEGKVAREIEVTGVKAAAALVAHAYALYVLHAAAGMRFGAVAAEKLSLFPLDAAQFYHSYPPDVRKDPLATLQAVMDTAGRQLSCQQRNSALGHLPDAVRSGSMLLTALAHTD